MSESDIFGYLFPPYVPPIIPAAPAAPRILRDEKYPPHRLSNQCNVDLLFCIFVY